MGLLEAVREAYWNGRRREALLLLRMEPWESADEHEKCVRGGGHYWFSWSGWEGSDSGRRCVMCHAEEGDNSHYRDHLQRLADRSEIQIEEVRP